MRHLLSANLTVGHLYRKTSGISLVEVAQPVLHMFFKIIDAILSRSDTYYALSSLKSYAILSVEIWIGSIDLVGELIIIIIMVIPKCYFSGEYIALSMKKQQRCEHRIRKNQQIKSTVRDAN